MWFLDARIKAAALLSLFRARTRDSNSIQLYGKGNHFMKPKSIKTDGFFMILLLILAKNKTVLLYSF
jgi:hypothetical protein